MNPPSDDTSLLNGLFSRGGRIDLEPRIYTVSGDLTLAVDGTSLIGSGGAVIQKTSASQLLVRASRCLIDCWLRIALHAAHIQHIAVIAGSSGTWLILRRGDSMGRSS